MHVLIHIGLVSLGGALGSVLRWGISVALARWVGMAFPWGTFAINLTGSLFLGWFMTVLQQRDVIQGVSSDRIDQLKLLIAVGFTGGYTTFSSFEYESNQLLVNGEGLKGLAYIFGSVFLGLAAMRLGIKLAGPVP